MDMVSMCDNTSREDAMRGKGADGGKATRWRALIGQAARSGTSVRAFCAAHGVTEAQFYRWQRKLRSSGAVKRRKVAEPAASFALVSADGEGLGDAGIELVLVGGKRLRIGRGVDAETLGRVVAVLERARC
jgi:hypothetical protein